MLSILRVSLICLVSGFLGAVAFGHGDVAPQPVNTEALPDVGEDWLSENPYRDVGDDVWRKAVEIGASGYNQNCARCHGLQGISGGLAPDLRYLEANFDGDEWFVERFRTGYTQNGVTKMPAFGDLLGQKAAWAIRTYVESRPDDGALDAYSDRLKAIRDELIETASGLKASKVGYGEIADRIMALKSEMADISGQIETASTAAVADSAASRAATALDGSPEGVKAAADVLTIGLSAAQ